MTPPDLASRLAKALKFHEPSWRDRADLPIAQQHATREGAKVERARTAKIDAALVALVKVIADYYVCQYCLEDKDETRYPHCLGYKSCKAVAQVEAALAKSLGE